jgi:prolyl-tRNA synthetase
VLLNQWANIVRWEMRTRLFLRTTEFLWQEGHTAHASSTEAEEETLRILGLYRRFMERWMAMPVITGVKTESEKFAGAVRTYALEAMMQDKRALQAGTSHFLGQNFAKAFGTQFQTADGGLDYVWSTSWGVSTRLIGGLIMTHSDDVGLVCPPRLAPTQVVIVPIFRKETERAAVMDVAGRIRAALTDAALRVDLDDREGMKPGAKYFEWEARGVPVRLEIGPRDVQQEQAVLARRMGGKSPVALAGIDDAVRTALDEIQTELLEAARDRREANSVRGVTKGQLIELMEAEGGFAYAGYCGDEACEQAIQQRTKATTRVLPDEEFRSATQPSTCVWCGRPAVAEGLWARAY